MMNSVFNRESLNKVFSHYSFFNGNIDQCTYVQKQIFGHIYKIAIGDKKWVIKRYEKNKHDIPRILLSHRIQNELIKNGFPLAKLESTLDGETMVQSNDFFYSVYRWVDGKQYYAERNDEADEIIIPEIAEALGKVHRFLYSRSYKIIDSKTVLSAETFFSKPYLMGKSLLRRQGFQLSQINKLKMKIKKKPFDHWIIDNVKDLMEIATSIEDLFNEQAREFEHIMPIHNDINWENLIFDLDNHLKAIIDFDNMIFAPRVCEIGAAAIVIAGPHSLKISNFIECYKRSSGFKTDIEAVKTSMIIKCLTSIFHSIRTHTIIKSQKTDKLQRWCYYLDKCLKHVITNW